MIRSNRSVGKVYKGRSSGDAKRVTNTNPLKLMDSIRSGIGKSSGSLSPLPGTMSNSGVIQSGMGGRDFKMKPNKVVRQRTAKDFT